MYSLYMHVMYVRTIQQHEHETWKEVNKGVAFYFYFIVFYYSYYSYLIMYNAPLRGYICTITLPTLHIRERGVFLSMIMSDRTKV